GCGGVSAIAGTRTGSAHHPEKACPGPDPGWKPVFGKPDEQTLFIVIIFDVDLVEPGLLEYMRAEFTLLLCVPHAGDVPRVLDLDDRHQRAAGFELNDLAGQIRHRSLPNLCRVLLASLAVPRKGITAISPRAAAKTGSNPRFRRCAGRRSCRDR